MCKISPVFRQFISIACCNLLTLAYGLSDGWAQINFIELQDENTTYSTGPLNSEELALIVAIANIGGFIGNFAVLPISQLIGVKRAIHLFGVPLILSSILIIYAQNAYYLYLSRILSGFAGGASAVAIPTLINDISFDNVRGALSSLYDPSYNVGIILSYFIANYLNLLDQAKVQLIIPGIFVVVLFFLPESPEFWIKKNVDKRAHKSRKFYQGKNIAEAEKAEFLPEPPNVQLNPGKMDSDNANDDVDRSISGRISKAVKQFCTPAAKRAFFISFTAVMLSFFSGIWILLTYITDVFNKTGSALSEKNSSLLVSIAPLLTNLIFLNLVERFNRRTLYIGSAIVCSLFYFLFAAYCQFWLKQPNYEWLPPFCFTFIILFNGMGLSPIPYILLIEIFPKEIQEMAIALGISLVWFVLFLIGYIFPFALNTMGIAACMLFFGIVCILNAIFCVTFIPETRGKSNEEIQELMTK